MLYKEHVTPSNPGLPSRHPAHRPAAMPFPPSACRTPPMSNWNVCPVEPSFLVLRHRQFASHVGNRFVRLFAAALFLIPCLPRLAAADNEPIDFEGDIRPIFNQHCAECHGLDERNGGISFADRTSLFREADSGMLPIVPGEPQNSELMLRIESDDEDLQMPPEGERLTVEQVAVLRDWIAAGAEWPEKKTSVSQAATDLSSHWSLQPIREPKLPHVDDLSWASNPIDCFVQAKRESAGLQVTADAAPETLLRRASYGLTGLPPSSQQIDEFQRAVEQLGTPTAFAALTEQLLNSPSYGERWGRHWMDWVRYADTAGDNSDYPIPQAYLYRNYIIDAFNADIPYDQFLIEQIAGDLLPAESLEQRNRQTIATGYLAMARRFGSLVERYPWHLTIEDTIDNMGRTMLGLTISCARCHDHKFDPISTRDYYGLYGIFASTRYPFPGIELFQAQRDFVPLIPEDQADKTLQPFQAETDKLTRELQKLLDECEQQALEYAASESAVSLAEQRKRVDKLDAMLLKARRAGEALAAHLKKIPDMPVAYGVGEATPTDARIQIKGEPTRLGAVVPRKFPDVLGGYSIAEDDRQSTSGRLQLAQWIASQENPLTARVIVNRVWQRHFGRGIVPSTSDFGIRGEPPTHPELLDWLAGEFMKSGWSIKHLHRLILNSRTYQLSSQDVESNLALDPDNHLLWKFNRQRLDAESLRDTLLLLGGTLDGTPQCEPHAFPPVQEWKYTQHHPFKDDYPSNKRSVYLMAKRLTAKPYFQTFDGPDPNVCTSDRDASVTALQALYFVNDTFLHEQSQRFAEQLVRSVPSDAERLRSAFVSILGRAAAADERQLLLQHLDVLRESLADHKSQEQAVWSSLTRSMLRLNEFMYID